MAGDEATSSPWGGGVEMTEWEDMSGGICSPLASAPVWFDQTTPRAGALAVQKRSKEGFEEGDELAAWEMCSSQTCSRTTSAPLLPAAEFADVWCASALPLPLASPPGVGSAQAQQAHETDASQASSRVASPVLVADLPVPACEASSRVAPPVLVADLPVPAVIIESSPEGDAKAGRGAPRPGVARGSAYDLAQVDEKTRRRLIKNRASAERSRMQRKAKMEELELRCERQEEEIQRLRAQLVSVTKHLDSDVRPFPVVNEPTVSWLEP